MPALSNYATERTFKHVSENSAVSSGPFEGIAEVWWQSILDELGVCLGWSYVILTQKGIKDKLIVYRNEFSLGVLTTALFRI
jgi:hypothetical protein